MSNKSEVVTCRVGEQYAKGLKKLAQVGWPARKLFESAIALMCKKKDIDIEEVSSADEKETPMPPGKKSYAFNFRLKEREAFELMEVIVGLKADDPNIVTRADGIRFIFEEGMKTQRKRFL